MQLKDQYRDALNVSQPAGAVGNIRPKLTIEHTPTEISLEILSVMALLWNLYMVLSAWNSLPDRIPSHFGYNGLPDSWAGKWILLLFPGITIFIYAVFTILSRYPHIYNYPWRITEQNAEAQYRLARTMITALKLEIISLFDFICYSLIQIVSGKMTGLGTTFLPVMLLIIFGTVGIYFFKAWKAK